MIQIYVMCAGLVLDRSSCLWQSLDWLDTEAGRSHTTCHLAQARQKRLQLLTQVDSRILLVMVPTTTDYAPLPRTTAEADAIARVVSGRAVSFQLANPRVADVLIRL